MTKSQSTCSDLYGVWVLGFGFCCFFSTAKGNETLPVPGRAARAAAAAAAQTHSTLILKRPARWRPLAPPSLRKP